MHLPSTTVLGTLALGTVGAVVAAGAALSSPSPVVPRGNDQPVTVTSPSALPCPAGTTEQQDECVRTVVVQQDAPEAVPPAPRAAAEQEPSPDATNDDEQGDRDGADESRSPEAEHEDSEDQEQESEHEDSEDEHGTESPEPQESEHEDGGSDD